MWTLSDESIEMMKRDAMLNHKSGVENFNRYKDLLNSEEFNNKMDYMKCNVVSAKIDFENAMNLYGAISLYREDYIAPIASKLLYQKTQIIFKQLLELEKSSTLEIKEA